MKDLSDAQLDELLFKLRSEKRALDQEHLKAREALKAQIMPLVAEFDRRAVIKEMERKYGVERMKKIVAP